MTLEAHRLMREFDAARERQSPQRLKRNSQAHVEAARLHLNHAMYLLKDVSRPDAITLLRIIRQLKPFGIDKDEPRTR